MPFPVRPFILPRSECSNLRWPNSRRVPTVLANLIHRKEMPVAIGIFITPGQRGETYPDSIGCANLNNRSVEYDSLGDTYARFTTEELLPEVSQSYNLTTDPKGRAIGGAST